MLHLPVLADLNADYAALIGFFNAPWSFHKIFVLVVAAFATMILYTIVRTNWVAEFRAIPYRFGLVWDDKKKVLAGGIIFATLGVVLVGFIRQNLHLLFDVKLWWGAPLGLLGTGAMYIGEAVFALLFSPFSGKAPEQPGLDDVKRQQAYGDARTAGSDEVDRALRGQGGGGRREFKD